MYDPLEELDVSSMPWVELCSAAALSLGNIFVPVILHFLLSYFIFIKVLGLMLFFILNKNHIR